MSEYRQPLWPWLVVTALVSLSGIGLGVAFVEVVL